MTVAEFKKIAEEEAARTAGHKVCFFSFGPAACQLPLFVTLLSHLTVPHIGQNV